MKASPRTWKDKVWLAWFSLQLPVIFCVDAVDKYPAWLCADEGSPLHALHRFRAWYTRTYNDPLVQWSPATHDRLGHGGGSWVPLFFYLELFFAAPTALYAVYHLSRAARAGQGTSATLELLLLVYAFEVALTTAVCINDVAYWDPAVYSPAQKRVFVLQLFGPWFAMNMYSRLLAHFREAEKSEKDKSE